MSASDPVGELDERFSSPGATTRSWSEVVAVLERAEMFWLSTTRRDGRPHVTPLPAVWTRDTLYFCTGPQEQKARNLDFAPTCAITTGINAQHSGLDIVIEGRAARVTDDALLHELAMLWETKLGWKFDVVDRRFRERGAEDSYASVDADGHDDAVVYGVAPVKVLAFGKGEPFSQSRYRF
jgi:general stress protein 26